MDSDKTNLKLSIRQHLPNQSNQLQKVTEIFWYNLALQCKLHVIIFIGSVAY